MGGASPLKQRSIYKFLVAEKCKLNEIYGRICHMLNKKCLQVGLTLVSQKMPESKGLRISILVWR